MATDTPFNDRDAHWRTALEILREFTEKFADAGVAVGGSVGRWQHSTSSDIDVVVASSSFPIDMQFATEVNGIGVAVVCLHPAGDERRHARWTTQAYGEDRLLSLITTARVLSDPMGVFETLRQNALLALLGNRFSEKVEGLLLREILTVSCHLRTLSGIDASRRAMQLAQVIAAWQLHISGVQGSLIKLDNIRIRTKALENSDQTTSLVAKNWDSSTRRELLLLAESILASRANVTLPNE